MSILRPIMTYWNPTVDGTPDTDGVTLTDVTLYKQDPSSISDGWKLNTDGTWRSRSYPTYAFDVSMGDGTWFDGTHAASYYEIRYSAEPGTTSTTFGSTDYGTYPPGANFDGSWIGGAASDHQIYGHTAHSPSLAWSGEQIRIEVRRASDSVMLANVVITFATA